MTRTRARGRLAPLCLAAALLVTALAAQAADAPIKVSATVEANDVAVGEPFVLSIVVDGAQNVPVPTVEVDGFRSAYLGPSTQVSLVNGHMSQSVTHRYRMIADREGQFSLGPFVIGHDDERYKTAPVPVHVRAANAKANTRAAAPGGADGLRLVVQPGKTSVYVGERVPLSVTLYVGNVSVRDLQFPAFSADGVTVEKFGQPEQDTEVIDGRRFTTVRLRSTMTMLRPGPIDLHATMAMNIATARRGADPFFDQVFGGNTKAVQLDADPVVVTVLPLPEAGKPPDFTGALGRFTFALDAKPTALDAGDPITLRMTIGGHGNLAGVNPPAVPVGDAFRRYDAQPVKGEDSPTERVFEQVLIPKRPEVREVPAVRFSFFDPDARAYQTITRGPIPIEVHAATGKATVVDGAPAAAPEAKPAAPLGRDIVFIKEAPGSFAPRGAAAEWSWLWVLQILPPLGFAGVWVFVRRRDRLAGDPRLARFRAAGRDARQALAVARADQAQAVDRISTAMVAYLGAKLDLPPGGVERERVLARLQAAGVDNGLRERIERFLDLSQHARYARGGDAAAERTTALDLATGIVDGLERVRGLERRLGALIVALCAVAALSVARADAPPPQAAFFQGNQAYAAGKYDDAVTAYDSVRRDGLTSGALEFNLGNAWVKRGDFGHAIAAYERAARLLPRDPDIAANLGFAREQAKLEVTAPLLWQRLAFPFAAAASRTTLGAVATALWWIFWLALAARLLLPAARVGLTRTVLATAIAWLIVASSWSFRVTELDAANAAVVVAPGETPARFEPSLSGTGHFSLTPGATLAVLEERDGWLQVRRSDGLRGWIPADAVERVD
ncbi:MAG: BatD family protein [bacterium]